MQTKRCANCHKLSRAEAVTCSRCGQSFAGNTTRVSTRSALTAPSGKRSAVVERSALRTRRRTIPPASPHRAGHYSGLHPEDQPYQSAMLAVQRPPARSSNPGAVVQQEKEEPEITPAPGLPRDLPEASSLPTLRRSTTPAGDNKEAHGLRAHQRYLPAAAPLKKEVIFRGKPLLQQRYVPTLLTISCLIFLVASGLLAYAFINKKPAPNSQVVTAIPDQLRVDDTFVLAGKGFGINDPLTFTYDQNSNPILDGNGRPLRAHADDIGTFSVQIIVPANWSVGQHMIHAIDSGKDQTVSVSAIITVEQSSLAPPQLQLSTSKLDFGTSVPGVVSKKDFILINAGGRQLTWQASSDQPWLTVSPNTGTFSGRGITQVVVNAGTLAPQAYSGHITFIQRGSSDRPLILTVTMTVKSAPPAVLTITPVSLTYSGTTSQNPADQAITVQNTGGRPLDWSSSIVTGDGAPWLSINPSSGHLAAHTSQTMKVSVQSQQLAIGSYQGTINFKGGTNPAVTVALSVAAPGNLIASPPSLSFASVGQNPAAQTITLQNSGGGPLDWTVTAATVDGANWLNATPASGHLEINQSGAVAININAAALKPQSYQGTLTFTYGGGLTKQVPVSLSVSIPLTAVISLNLSRLNFTTLQGTNPAPLSFTLSNTGNATLNWVIAEDQNGATFAPVSSAAGSLAPNRSTGITVTPNVAQAGAGTLYTTITVADSDPGSKVPAQRITVSIVVQGRAQITLSTSTMDFSHDNIFTESTQLLDISNTGSKTLYWVTKSTASWLTVYTPPGSLNPGNDILLEVDCNSASLSPGTYTATLTVSDSDSGPAVQPQKLAVTLVVT